jgi:hypothetical protein
VSRHRWVAWAIGGGLIALGIGGLIWSHALTPGWWQDTFQALGVGFGVGGVVDVLVVPGIQQFQQRQDANLRGVSILRSVPWLQEEPVAPDMKEVQGLLDSRLLYPEIHRGLQTLADKERQ